MCFFFFPLCDFPWLLASLNIDKTWFEHSECLKDVNLSARSLSEKKQSRVCLCARAHASPCVHARKTLVTCLTWSKSKSCEQTRRPQNRFHPPKIAFNVTSKKRGGGIVFFFLCGKPFTAEWRLATLPGEHLSGDKDLSNLEDESCTVHTAWAVLANWNSSIVLVLESTPGNVFLPWNFPKVY